MRMGCFPPRRAACALGFFLLALAPAAVADRATGQDTPPVFGPAPSLEERADAYMARKMYREAIDTFSRIQPANAETLNKIGIACQMQNDYAEARKFYQRAAKAKPRYAEPLNNLGTVYYAQRSYRRATTYYNRALALQPLSATMHINLGMAWLARHNEAEWQRHFQRALELDPNVFERRGGHGVLIEEHSTEQRAKFDLYLARLYARRGDNDLALQYVRKALEVGLKERKHLLEDADFAALRQLPEFDALLKQPPKVL